MKQDNLKFTNNYTQKVPIITGIIFCISLIYILFNLNKLSGVYDTTVYTTIITITGTIFLTSLITALNKFKSENLSIIKIETYKACSKERLHFNREMCKMMKEFGLRQEDIELMEQSSDLDEFMDEAKDSVMDSINSRIANASEEIEKVEVI